MTGRDRVTEGRLVEVPTPDATGMDRRAFGEFASHRGELASYAVGWVSGGDERVGRLTIGMGAGNPGGGTFHMAVGVGEDGRYGLRLVDEPFEDVPEGGPDMTREDALAHEDLPWIWAASDRIMRLDRRALWMLHWVLETLTYISAPVFAQDEPVLHVVHEAEPDRWAMIGASDTEGDGRIHHLHHAVDEDQTLLDVLDLPPGEEALRGEVGGEWVRRRL
ncbi:MAG: hypothetical protein ABW060_05735 [Solirubrobacteraceae bacterium]